jgi:ferredoxin--NADP+ reductase
MSNLNTETVLDVRHWTDTMFSFTTTRDPAFRFRSGQFVMMGLAVDERPLLRAYSIVSTPYDERLEFLSIKVDGGPLTSRLRHIQPGHEVLVGRKPVGTLLADNLRPGRNLFLLSTGTGLAPFMSLIRDPEVYDRFQRIVLVHGTRTVAELAYEEVITRTLPTDEFIGELAREQLLYYPTVTREPFRNQGRITGLIENGKLCADLGLPPLEQAHDRIMICGNPGLLTDMTEYLERMGFQEGNNSEPGDYVIEKAFVEK